MKYGVVWFRKSENLGDDIQTYAAARFLPRVDYYIEREHLDEFFPDNEEMVAVIMNGWYFYSHLNWPPSPFLFPLPIAMHFDTVDGSVAGRFLKENMVISGYGAEWLKKWSPIGARDYHTLHLLQDNKISSFFSGCLTMTLKKFENVMHHDFVIAVDVSDAVVDRIKIKTKKNVMVRTHKLKMDKYTIDERMHLVEERLKEYQGASLVVTTRLHVALPCLALGVPVLFIKTFNENIRIDTYLEYLHWVLEEDIDNYDFDNPLENKELFKKVAQDLEKLSCSFVESCKKIEISPSVKEIYFDEIERIKRLKAIFIRECEEVVKNEKFIKYE